MTRSLRLQKVHVIIVMYKVAWYVSREIKMLQVTHQCCDISIFYMTYQYCNIWHHGVLCYYVSYYSIITSSMQNKKIINENSWCGRHISLPHHISIKHLKLTEKTGVAKPYPCHTTFQTGVAASHPTSGTPAGDITDIYGALKATQSVY